VRDVRSATAEELEDECVGDDDEDGEAPQVVIH
jgi:hypothetical protein